MPVGNPNKQLKSAIIPVLASRPPQKSKVVSFDRIEYLMIYIASFGDFECEMPSDGRPIVPDDHVSSAKAQLSFERGTAFMPSQIQTQNTIENLIALARKTRLEDGRLAIDDDHIAFERLIVVDDDVSSSVLLRQKLTISSFFRETISTGMPPSVVTIHLLLVSIELAYEHFACLTSDA